MSTRDIHLLGGRPIYFPFLSGILTYDCASCDARCCKGAQLGIGRSRELAGLLHLSPSLALFAGEAFPSGPLPILETVMEQCWFLGSDNLCRLERAVGRDHKPAGCRLFPFNQFRRCGEYVVVLPHFQCPIGVASEPAMDGPHSHDALALEMHLTSLSPDGHPSLGHPENGSWATTIPLERDIRDIGAAHLRALDYATHADVQMDMTRDALGTPKGPRCTVLRKHMAAFLGYGDGKLSKAGVHDLVALTPYLRMRLAYLPREQVPGILTAVSVMAAVLEGMPGGKVGPRSLVHLLEKRAPMLIALSHLLDKPRLAVGFTGESLVRRASDVSPLVGKVLLAVEANQDAAHPAALGEILQSMPEFQAPLTPEAVGALMRLGKYVPEAVEFLPG